jgi:hypothetical protein
VHDSFAGAESTMGNNASSLASPFAGQSRSTSTAQASQPDEETDALLTQESDTSQKLSFSDQDTENGDHEMEQQSEHEDAKMATDEHETHTDEERGRPSNEGPDLASSSQDTEMVKDTGREESAQDRVPENKGESQLEVQDDSGTWSDEDARERVSTSFFLTQPDPDSRENSNVEEDGGSDTFNTELEMENTGEPLPCDSDALDRPATQQGSDDESTSDESDGSSASDDSAMPYGEDYMEIVERNMRRNKERLSFLGFETKAQTPVRRKTPTQEKSPEIVVPTGMLFTTEAASKRSDARYDDIDELYRRYPNRNFQIKTLVSLIGAAMGQTVNQGDDPYVPPPIFVSGPSGTGKTSIVCEVLDILKRRYSSDCGVNSAKRIIGSAYVNCATVEPSSLEAVLESAYSQLTSSLELPPRTRRVRKAKRKRDATLCGLKQKMQIVDGFTIPSNDVEYNTDNEADLEDAIEASKSTQSPMKQCGQNESESVANPVIRLGPRRTGDGANASTSQTDTAENPVRRERRRTRNGTNVLPSKTVPGANFPSVPENKSIRKVEPIAKSHCAPMALGRVLVPLFGSPSLRSMPNIQPGSAFLVLDHAERLFSLSPNQSIESNNFLTQLLLLPQVMGLNLTFILVSRSTLLESSNMHNSSSVQKALGTVAIGISPIRVQFPAYQGNAAFKAILKQPNILQLIVGRQRFENNQDDQRTKFQASNIDSFLDTLVQSLSSVTRDVREMIRIGRMLWPSYILPLNPQHIQTTLDAARRRSNARRGKSNECSEVDDAIADQCQAEELHKELLAILDEALLPIMKTCLEEDMFVMKGHDTRLVAQVGNADSATAGDKASCHSDLPYLSKCLLLAAFVCQNNKSDKDKALFTIQRNGKKNSRKGDRAGDNDADALAYGSTSLEQQQLKMLRPRTFPLERMLSVFVNIVGLIGGEEKRQLSVNVSEPKDLLQLMGSSCFFESLSRLREIGLLHEVQGNSIGSDTYTSFEGIDMTSTKYWCELSRDDAEAFAKSVDFPLDNFLI